MYLNSFFMITVQTNHSGHVTERDKHKENPKRLFFTKKVQHTHTKKPSFKSHNSLQ